MVLPKGMRATFLGCSPKKEKGNTYVARVGSPYFQRQEDPWSSQPASQAYVTKFPANVPAWNKKVEGGQGPTPEVVLEDVHKYLYPFLPHP